ncbi:hypothetical protein OG866_17725 [Streptomyces sp. NBC_00663]|uniref:hypothetical protein n=1 Tax=Streptomyces sp. NBC_00663 TaxID=2975801 RepID=UPI002E37C110|nr:hypothetical protein [Streptomyces sp. NBC_00663]
MRPLAGLSDAWSWSPVPGLDFAAALSEDGRRLFQVNARDTYDERLVVALLRAARENSARLLADGVLLGTVPGFRYPGRGFEVIAAARPGVHRYHEVRQPELQRVTWAVFPGYACEFAAPDRYHSLGDARESFRRFLSPADLSRQQPAPFLRVWYDNTVTKGGTDAPEGILVARTTLYREIRLLEGAPGSFVRFENFRGQVWQVAWDEQHAWTLGSGAVPVPSRCLGLAELLSFAEESLHA